MSSTWRATLGYLLQTQAPLWPYFWNLNGDFISGPGLPLKTSILIFLPLFLSSSGLGSNRSKPLGPPSMKSQITDLTLGAKWGGRGARGLLLAGWSAAAAERSRSPRASRPSPPPAWARNWRRLFGRIK